MELELKKNINKCFDRKGKTGLKIKSLLRQEQSLKLMSADSGLSQEMRANITSKNMTVTPNLIRCRDAESLSHHFSKVRPALMSGQSFPCSKHECIQSYQWQKAGFVRPAKWIAPPLSVFV